MFDLVSNNPFKHTEVTTNTRLYISFLKEKPVPALTFPWTSNDGSYRILEVREKTICSVLDLSATQTPKGMDAFWKKHDDQKLEHDPSDCRSMQSVNLKKDVFLIL
jgi:hypothetical protein